MPFQDEPLPVTSGDQSPRRILYVEGNTDGTIGGSYFSLLFLVSGLDRSRFEPVVAFGQENELRERFHERGIRTFVRPPASPVRLPGMPGKLLAKAVNLFRGAVLEPFRLASLLRRERISLVHLNNSIRRNHPWILGAWLARLPCITHERGINEVFQRRDRLQARLLRRVICISDAVESNFHAKGLGKLPLVTIHNGLDPNEMKVTRDANEVRAELGLPEKARLIGVVGNIKSWKGQAVAIEAFAAIHDEFPDLVLVLIGDSSEDDRSYRHEIDARIRELGLEDRVLITGFRRNVANFIAPLEILIHTSVQPEPFGRVLLEGMALGKPLVASNAGGVPEIVLDGETGLVYPPGNPRALAECLRALLRDPQRAAELGANGRRRVATHFSIQENFERTQAIYAELLGPSDRAAG